MREVKEFHTLYKRNSILAVSEEGEEHSNISKPIAFIKEELTE